MKDPPPTTTINTTPGTERPAVRIAALVFAAAAAARGAK